MPKSTSRLAAVAAGALLASLALSGPAAHAAPGAHARPCKPALRVLASLPGPGESPAPWSASTEVRDLGRAGLAVGRSQNRPAYWRGTSVHAVPLPAGYTSGAVEAVNRWGVMVGAMSGPGHPPAAFRYAPGMRAAKRLPGGDYAADINDRGHIAGYRALPDGKGVGLEWTGGTLRRELVLPAHTTHLRSVTAINNAGLITGTSWGLADDAGYDAALLWTADPAAPATELPEVYPGDSYSTYEPREIDESGRITGTYGFTRIDVTNGTTWLPPYTTRTPAPDLGDRTKGTFEDISPTTGVSVGIASDSFIIGPFPPDTAPPYQAQYWKGSGPVLALPRLAGTPGAHAGAYAVSDDDRVGGFAVDAADVMHPVVWTCASKQAYLPPAGS